MLVLGTMVAWVHAGPATRTPRTREAPPGARFPASGQHLFDYSVLQKFIGSRMIDAGRSDVCLAVEQGFQMLDSPVHVRYTPTPGNAKSF
jgi:hypothetical protein